MDPMVFSFIFIFAVFCLFLEILAGGGIFGILFVVGLIITMPALGIVPLFLVVVGCVLILLEVFRPARGLFFILGNLFLFSSFLFPLLFSRIWWFSLVLLFCLFGGSLLISFLFFLSFRKVRSLRNQKELFAMEGTEGTVMENTSYAKISGTSWRIASENPLVPGDKVKVVRFLDDLVLFVQKEE